MQQYFIDSKVLDTIEFNEEQSFHIQRVLRMKEGTVVKVVDADENAAFVTIHYEQKKVLGILKEKLEPQKRKIRITLAASLIKKDKWDFCIQKACECGAYTIAPFVSERSIVRIQDEKNEKKRMRWQKIALEACEQSKQDHCTQIMDVCEFSEILEMKSDLKLIAYENADRIASNIATILKKNPDVKDILIVIGPEGGFSEEEVKKALDHDFVCVSLGESILRAETASICAITMLRYHYELLKEGIEYD